MINHRQARENESEQFGRIIEDSLSEVYFISPETLNVISLNKGARENLGYSAKEIHEKIFTSIATEYSLEDFGALVDPLVKGKKRKISYQTKHQRKDGTTYLVGGSLQYSTVPNKPVLFAIVEDISEKTVTEERLKQTQQMKAVGNLSSGVAHDFNNLLTAIRGSLHLMEMSSSGMDKVTKECIDIAIKTTRRGADLTRRLMAFSRKQSLSPEKVEINDVIKSATPLLQRTIGEVIEIEYHSSAKDLFVNIDVPEFENALVNLVINARDAMPNGGHLLIEVDENNVSPEQAEMWGIQSGLYSVISISDNGCGMSQEIIDRIYEPFFTTKPAGKGTGLGLSMVYGFVKQTGGYLSIYSEIEKGTTVRIYLQSLQAGKQPTPKKEVFTKPQAAGSGVILLVEDEEPVRNFVATALKTRGYLLLVAFDGPGAVKIMEEEKVIDLLFTDVILPNGMLGPEIGEKFTKIFPGGGHIYSSGYTGKSLEQKGFHLKEEDMLTKPYDLSEMFEKVRTKTQQK